MNKSRQVITGSTTMEFGPQLVPTLREGIDVIKMVLYQELKSLLLLRHGDPAYVNKLTSAVVNDLFGIIHPGTAIEIFSQANQDAVEKVFQMISTQLDHLKIPLTDALRIQFLCDSHESLDSTAVLEKAEKRKLLLVERDVPLPGAFMNTVRSFGRSYGILDPQPLTPPVTTQTNPNGATDK
jgi:hypothetical protein